LPITIQMRHDRKCRHVPRVIGLNISGWNLDLNLNRITNPGNNYNIWVEILHQLSIAIGVAIDRSLM
jgi:hypothetical protein